MICPSLRCPCGQSIRLPYPSARETVSIPPGWAPKEVLAREVACLECGRTLPYTVRDVRWDQVPQPDPNSGRADVVCWGIETGCEEELCDLPIEFHILTDAQKGPEEIRFLILRLFERGFFPKLICGRGHRPVRNRIRTVRRVA